MADVGKTLVEHGLGHVGDVVEHEINLGVVHLAGNHKVGFEHKVDHTHFLLGVGTDGIDGAGGVGHGIVDTFFGILGHFDRREHLLDFAFDVGRVDVTDYDDSLIVGTIPCLIVVADSLRLEVVDHFHDADRQTMSVFAVGIDGGEEFFEDTHLANHGAAPFFMNHTTFLVDFLGVESKVVGPVVEDKEARVLYALTSHGHVGNVVDSLINTGVGIEVDAKLHTNRFEPVAERRAGIIGCAVETHVFKEVSQTALVVFFENRTDRLGDIEIGLAFGRFIMTDVVGEAIVEFAFDNRTVDWQFGHLRHLLGLCGYTCRHGSNEDECGTFK